MNARKSHTELISSNKSQGRAATMKHERFLPNFLGIGAQRAGTSWLYSILKRHPSVWMPPLKELHYFDRSPAYPSPSHLASEEIIPRLFGTRSYHSEYRSRLIRRIVADYRRSNWRRISWDIRYFFGRYTDDWYASLFMNGDGKVRGEITPSYSILHERDVEHVRNLIPKLKTILILRNPVERAWSQIRKNGIYDRPTADLKLFVDSPFQDLRSNYIRTMSIWRSYFPKEQFFVGFFDDIKLDPIGILSNVCEFLGIDPRVLDTRGMYSIVNASASKKMPSELESYLAKKYYEQIKQLSNMLGRHATSWLRKAEQTLSDADLTVR